MKISGTGFGKAADDYGAYRAGFPDSIFDRLRAFDVGLPGQNVVDLGTGTGTLARGFAGRGCSVTGVDPDLRMLQQARALDADEDAALDYVNATAEHTGLAEGCADVVSAGQCWHWFDRPLASTEARRLLVPAGRLVVAYFDWLPLPGNVVEATEHLIEAHNPAWRLGGGLGVHANWLPGLSGAGFEQLETFSYDLDAPYSAEAWRGRIRASAGIVALDADATARFDEALADLLAKNYADQLQVPHRVFAIVAVSP